MYSSHYPEEGESLEEYLSHDDSLYFEDGKNYANLLSFGFFYIVLLP